ncbi:pyruvate ferredoxin oxidoreductase [bacterium]|nr:pyruvate ferredoxin oxidoreductase [bacterium]
MKIIESGNVAAATGVMLSRAQVIAAYPITPQTPLTEKLSEMVESGQMKAEYIAVESEHSALSVCIGAASAGARAFTATSANGLLYMSEQVYWSAGARLPLVMCVVNRGLGAPWTIWNDHQDSMSQRDAGWIQIYVNNHQEIIDTIIKAYRLAQTVSIPVMVCFDGYYLSHTYMPYEVPSQKLVDEFLPKYYYKHTLDPANPENLNTVTMPYGRPDANGEFRNGYMDIRHNHHQEMVNAIKTFEETDKEFEHLFGRGGNPLVAGYKCDDADYIVVLMGSLSNRLKDIADDFRDQGTKIGVLSVHLYRPFPAQAIVNALENAKGVVVFEKSISYGYQGGLYSDIKAAMYNIKNRPFIHNHIIGLGGRLIKNEDLIEAINRSIASQQELDNQPQWIGLNR